MLNPQRPAPEDGPDAGSLTLEERRPLRIVVNNQNSLSDLHSARSMSTGSTCVARRAGR